MNRLPDREPAPVFPTDLRLFHEPAKTRYFELTLDRPADVSPNVLVANLDACGGGFTVRDCTIRNHRARGMLIRSGPGLIEDCTVEGSSITGIVVAPEMGYWNESGHARGLVLRGNTIRRVGIWSQPWLNQAGALTVAAYERGRFVPLPGGHRDILIENNHFEQSDGVNVLISSAVGVTLRGNEFIRPMENASDRGRTQDLDDAALMWFTECRDVRLENNRVRQPGAFLKRLVAPTDTAAVSAGTEGVAVVDPHTP